MFLLSNLKLFIAEIRRKRGLSKSMTFMDDRAGVTAREFSAKPLSSEERSLKKSFWRQYVERVPGDSYYELAKQIRGFDVRYIPESIFYTMILNRLNDHDEALILQDKNMYGFYYQKEDRPYEVCRNVRGIFYNDKNEIISSSQAVDEILRYGNSLIVKPTVDTEQGHNVIRLSQYDRNDIVNLFSKYQENFVFQEAVNQIDEIAVFNPTSLNTIRIVSLFLNGKYSVLASALRCGAKGAIIDNAGGGGMMVGIHEDGTLYDYGINKSGTIFQMSHTGVTLKGYKLKCFQNVTRYVRHLHEQMPFLPFIGWDIAVRKDGTPTFIELGASSTGIFVIQLCCGPIFGDRFDEVFEYLRKKAKGQILTSRIEKKYRTC